MANDTLIWLEAATALRPDDPAMRQLQVLEPRAAAPLYPQETNPGKDWWRGLPEQPELDDVPGGGGRFGPGAGPARGGSAGGTGGLETPWGRMGERGPLGDRGSTPEGWNMGRPRFPRLGGGLPASVDPRSRWDAEIFQLEKDLQQALTRLDGKIAEFNAEQAKPSGQRSNFGLMLLRREIESRMLVVDAIYEELIKKGGMYMGADGSGSRPPYGLSHSERRRLKAREFWAQFDSATRPSPWTPLVGPDGGRGRLGFGVATGTVDSRGFTPVDEGGSGNSPWLVPEMHDVTNTDQSSSYRPASPQLRGYAQRIFALVDPPRDL